jgi:hypothetical protein
MAKHEEDLDPAADTQMFQAFVDRRELDEQEATTSGGRLTTVVIAAAVALVVVLVLVWLMLFR